MATSAAGQFLRAGARRLGRSDDAPASRPTRLAVVGLLMTVSAINIMVSAQEVLKGNFAHDYRYNFLAGRIGLASGWARIYSLPLQQHEWAHSWSDWFPFTPFINPPPVAWVGAPLVTLPWTTARVLWMIGVGLLALLTVLLAAPATWRHRLGYGLLAVAFTPVLGVVRDGQVIVLVAAGIVLGVRLIESGHEVLSGFAFSLIGVKPHVAMMVPIALAVAGHWRAIVALLGTSVAWVGASLLSVGASGVHDYIGLLHWAAIFQTPRQRSLMWLAGSGPAVAGLEAMAMVAVVAAMLSLRRHRLRVVLSVAVVGSLMVSPYVNAGDLSLLLLPLWLVFDGRWSALASVGAALVGTVEILEFWPRLVPLVELLAVVAFVTAASQTSLRSARATERVPPDRARVADGAPGRKG
ncbi:MAG TPA: glycosyltransferase family 87 protein [Candidatus Dormibacteraeota bacterium]|nr:glycosyltransferase family 87 protein [Candidatus Dormibacteraeota bacterium]